MMKSKLVIVWSSDPRVAVSSLDRLELRISQPKIVIKPNLIWDRPPPVTTPLDLVVALVEYFKQYSSQIIVAEGSGWCETWRAFSKLGYLQASARYGFKLVDLNKDEYQLVSNPNALVLTQFKLPATLSNCFLISAAVLKQHSLTGVSLSLKNLLGASLGEPTPRAKKLIFHKLGIDPSIIDLVRYLRPGLGAIDARQACLGGELGGRSKRIGCFLFSQDLVALDALGAKLLGRDPAEIKHIALAASMGLGTMDLAELEIIELRPG